MINFNKNQLLLVTGLLILAAVLIAVIWPALNKKDSSLCDYPPYLMWENSLYKISSESPNEQFIKEELGNITSFINMGMPDNNGETNTFNVGDSIFGYGDDDSALVVRCNDTYWLVLKKED
jgi:hypothetical protein